MLTHRFFCFSKQTPLFRVYNDVLEAQIKLVPVMPCNASIPYRLQLELTAALPLLVLLPANVPGKAAEDDPCTYVENLEESAGFQFWARSPLVIAVVEGVRQQIEDLDSLFLLLSKTFN